VQNYITVFSFAGMQKPHSTVSSMFPPPPPDNTLIMDVINGYCDEITPNAIKEDGCAVCACLYPLSHLTNLLEAKVDLDILTMHGVTRKERFEQSDPITWSSDS